jgi:hypothetical protein
MFSSPLTAKLAQRTLGALRLTRSFLLLEDDYDVDWEVDQDEPSRTAKHHPHRVPLRERATAGRFSNGRLAHRRPGQSDPHVHVCISPITRPAPSHERRPVRRKVAEQQRTPRNDASLR